MRPLTEQEQRLREEEQSVRQAFREARRDQAQAENQASAALATLPHRYSMQIKPSANADIATCLAVDYPTQEELSVLYKRADQYKLKQQHLKELDERASKREKVRIQHQAAVKRLRHLEAMYPVERVQELRSAQQTAKREGEEATKRLAQMHKALLDAEQTLQSAEKAVKESEAKHYQAISRGEAETALKQKLQWIVAGVESELPDAWRIAAASLTEELLVGWQTEAASLIGADSQREKLSEARRQQEARERHLHQLQQEIRQLPSEAQRSLAELESKEREVRQRHAEADEARCRAELDKQSLEMRRGQRRELETKHCDATRQAQLYNKLARLLGRDNLQHYLLQQAEAGIVANANAVLDHISGGTLRFELRPAEEAPDSDNFVKGPSKALDLIAYNTETSALPLPVALLSGSQRFRVAVSLALGIGQYAARGTRRIESVIVDEGFGSLDKDGRHEMIDEFHTLKNVLSRIILVSHQEEFASAFTNGYEIKLENGTSTASILG